MGAEEAEDGPSPAPADGVHAHRSSRRLRRTRIRIIRHQLSSDVESVVVDDALDLVSQKSSTVLDGLDQTF